MGQTLCQRYESGNHNVYINLVATCHLLDRSMRGMMSHNAELKLKKKYCKLLYK